MDLNSYTTLLPAFSMSARESILDDIALNERTYEELISIRLNSDVRGDVDFLADERDSDDADPDQIDRCNLLGWPRSNRIITAPARSYGYF